jgi:hypothetical protein
MITGRHIASTNFARGPGKYMLARRGVDIFPQLFEAKEGNKESSGKPS